MAEGAERGGAGAPLRVRIEFEPGRTPVAGRVVPGAGEPERFSGYVEMIAAIERLRETAAAGAEKP